MTTNWTFGGTPPKAKIPMKLDTTPTLPVPTTGWTNVTSSYPGATKEAVIAAFGGNVPYNLGGGNRAYTTNTNNMLAVVGNAPANFALYEPIIAAPIVSSGGGGVGWGYLANGTWGKLPAGTWKPAGGGVVPTWSSSYSVPNAPSWWKGMTYSGEDANSKYAMMLNALIPSLSPEDQRAMATYLYQTFNQTMPTAFSAYNPEVANYGAVPKINTELQTQFTSKKRATDALSALDKMVTGAGKPATSFGEGYTYLRNLLSTMGSFGGESAINKQTREQVVQQLGAVSPLLAQAKGTLAPYASIAQALTTPFFSSGSVMPISKDAKGNYIFGEANKRLY